MYILFVVLEKKNIKLENKKEMSTDSSVKNELISLFWSFITNAADYSKVLIPLYIIYKLYIDYSFLLKRS